MLRPVFYLAAAWRFKASHAGGSRVPRPEGGVGERSELGVGEAESHSKPLPGA